MQLITINDAASTSGKSVQTIRRMVKQKKIEVKKQKTPQGFNYLIVKESLFEYLKQFAPLEKDANAPAPVTPDTSREHGSIAKVGAENYKDELDRFSSTIQKLIDQNEKDKENFFSLIKTFQDRIGILENHIKLLEAPPAKWWQLWK